MKRSCSNCIHDKLCDKVAIETGIPFVNPEICEDYMNKDDVVEVGCGKWMHINDKLPEKYVNCLVHYIHSYNSDDGYWAIGVCHYNGEEFLIDKVYQVTHWMPLPKPPERRL